eukprot:jgi/Tetstr1/447761/TSEL_035094.t1
MKIPGTDHERRSFTPVRTAGAGGGRALQGSGPRGQQGREGGDMEESSRPPCEIDLVSPARRGAIAAATEADDTVDLTNSDGEDGVVTAGQKRPAEGAPGGSSGSSPVRHQLPASFGFGPTIQMPSDPYRIGAAPRQLPASFAQPSPPLAQWGCAPPGQPPFRSAHSEHLHAALRLGQQAHTLPPWHHSQQHPAPLGPGGGPLGGGPLPSPYAAQIEAAQHARAAGAEPPSVANANVNAVPLARPAGPPAETKRALRAVVEALSRADAKPREAPHGLLKVDIMPHQRLALGWMCAREEGCLPVGGILADDQGLGKTVSTISLIVTRPPNRKAAAGAGTGAGSGPSPPKVAGGSGQKGTSGVGAELPGDGAAAVAAAAEEGQEVIEMCDTDSGSSDDIDFLEVSEEEVGPKRPAAGTLVVCPTAVLHQWANEIRDKVDLAAGLTVSIYHGKDKVREPEILAGCGVVLTTYTTMALEAPLKLRHHKGKVEGAEGAGPNRGEEGGPLFRVYWHRVVLDEGHSIKNGRTIGARAAWHLAARHRWILSGTPLQNSIEDLYSYFKFLRYAPYNDHAAFKRLIKDPISSKASVGYKRLNAVLKGVMLRRRKDSVVDGKPVVDLPSCTHTMLRKKFSPQERRLYDQIYKESTSQFQAMQAAGSVKSNYVNILLMLLRLRQACNHPLLVKGGRASMGDASAQPPGPEELAAAAALAPELRESLLRAAAEGSQLCPVCGDIPEEAVVAVCGHVYCSTCISTRMADSEWENNPRCLTCNAKLADRRSVHSPAALVQCTMDGAGAGIGNGVAGAAGRPGGGSSAGAAASLSGAVASAKVEQLMTLLTALRNRQLPAAPAAVPGGGPPRLLTGGSKGDRRMAAAFGRRSKATALPALPQEPVAVPPPGAELPDKVLVFSQWTGMLNLVETPLRDAGIQFRRLDGSMNIAKREEAISDFKEKPHVMVLLVSLKAAALGLNLVVANHVVLLDLWWNPTTEQQAIDRTHRIGQTRKVQVTRITIEGTVEERILALQRRKQEMVEAAFGEGSGAGGAQSAARLTQQDLEFLFT